MICRIGSSCTEAEGDKRHDFILCDGSIGKKRFAALPFRGRAAPRGAVEVAVPRPFRRPFTARSKLHSTTHRNRIGPERAAKAAGGRLRCAGSVVWTRSRWAAHGRLAGRAGGACSDLLPPGEPKPGRTYEQAPRESRARCGRGSCRIEGARWPRPPPSLSKIGKPDGKRHRGYLPGRRLRDL